MIKKNKKGFVFGILGLIYLMLIIVLVGLLIWFGFRISAGISAFVGLIRQWWWVGLILIMLLLFYQQIRAILNAILRRFGIKV